MKWLKNLFNRDVATHGFMYSDGDLWVAVVLQGTYYGDADEIINQLQAEYYGFTNRT